VQWWRTGRKVDTDRRASPIHTYTQTSRTKELKPTFVPAATTEPDLALVRFENGDKPISDAMTNAVKLAKERMA